MQKEFLVENLQDISLDIYTIGYPGMGEAILSVISEGDNVLFTTLTDCFVTSSCNHISSILDARGISDIDVFIWTHPDEEHSVGIRGILEKYDTRRLAKIYLPEEFTSKTPFQVCKQASEALQFITEKYNIGKKYNVTTVGVGEDEARNLINLKFTEKQGENMIRCQWQFVAPFSSLAWRQASKEKFRLNDLSIVYSMYFNGANFLFCGDLGESTIRFMNDLYFQNVYFIKIPHHGSPMEPKSFVRKLQDKQVQDALAVTTSFKSTHPAPDVLDSYKKISREIDCTGDAAHVADTYGCVKASFNISSLTFQTELSGNAFCYYQ